MIFYFIFLQFQNSKNSHGGQTSMAGGEQIQHSTPHCHPQILNKTSNLLCYNILAGLAATTHRSLIKMTPMETMNEN
jgi:hypothetical protein